MPDALEPAVSPACCTSTSKLTPGRILKKLFKIYLSFVSSWAQELRCLFLPGEKSKKPWPSCAVPGQGDREKLLGVFLAEPMSPCSVLSVPCLAPGNYLTQQAGSHFQSHSLTPD